MAYFFQIITLFPGYIINMLRVNDHRKKSVPNISTNEFFLRQIKKIHPIFGCFSKEKYLAQNEWMNDVGVCGKVQLRIILGAEVERFSDKGLVGRPPLLQSLKGSAGCYPFDICTYFSILLSFFYFHIYHFGFHISHFGFDISNCLQSGALSLAKHGPLYSRPVWTLCRLNFVTAWTEVL